MEPPVIPGPSAAEINRRSAIVWRLRWRSRPGSPEWEAWGRVGAALFEDRREAMAREPRPSLVRRLAALRVEGPPWME